MALPTVHRLRRRHEFAAVYQAGRRFRGQLMTLRTLQRRSPLAQSPSRLGVSISQKVSKRAVVRNRIRRRLHGIFLALRPRLQPGWDLVLVVHPPASQCEYAEFLRELEKLLQEANVLNGHS